MHYHPWRAVRLLPDWRVIYRDLPDGDFAYTHQPSRTVVIEQSLTQAERRSTIAHELEHVMAGHHGCQPARIERAVIDRSTRRLLPLAFVVDGLAWVRHSHSLWEFAEHTWVDLDTAEHRLDMLNDDEWREVNQRLCDLEPMLR